MTLALILISYLQVLFLPGYLYCLYKKKFNLFLIISISIFFNYLIIIFFSNFSFDKQFFILGIICLEILFIFYFILFLKKNYKINFYFDIYKILNCLIIIFILTNYFYISINILEHYLMMEMCYYHGLSGHIFY